MFTLICSAFFLVCAQARQAQKPFLRIISPPDRTVVRPGQTVHVAVAAQGDFTNLMIFGEDPLPESHVRKAPPYTFSIKVPKKDIDPGLYSITADGVLRSGENIDSDPIDLDVERSDVPLRISVSPSILDIYVGEGGNLQVIGIYKDDSEVYLTNSTQTTIVSEAPSIAKVTQGHRITGVAPGKTNIIINGKIAVKVTVRAGRR